MSKFGADATLTQAIMFKVGAGAGTGTGAGTGIAAWNLHPAAVP